MNLYWFLVNATLSALQMAAERQAEDAWTPIVVRNVTRLGAQKSTEVPHFSRDGGHSVLLNGRIVWLYDDTECFSANGGQLSFLSNTAAYAFDPQADIATVLDFGAVDVGTDADGNTHRALLADEVAGGGGWIRFTPEELDFNSEHGGDKRIAIWPGTSPAPVDATRALLYAPVVLVDRDPEDPRVMFVPRGVTTVWVAAPDEGPLAIRSNALLFPEDHVPYGVFAAVVGSPSVDTAAFRANDDLDVYAFAAAESGLYLARVTLDEVDDPAAYTYFRASERRFVTEAPGFYNEDEGEMYLPGTFTSGNVFFSPFFRTFVIIYMNRMVDSTFYIRHLDLENPLDPESTIWRQGGKRSEGITAEDVEALVKYAWSAEQVLYKSPPGPGGFNYLGAAHPEYFSRQYYPASRRYKTGERHPDTNGGEWYGSGEVPESDAGGDGRHLLLSWTSQIRGGLDTGIYEIQLARVEFGDVPERPEATSSSSSSSTPTPAPPEDTGLLPPRPSSPETSDSRRARTPSAIWTSLLMLSGPAAFGRG